MRQSTNFGPNQIPHPPIPVPRESVETFAQYDYEISIRSLFYDPNRQKAHDFSCGMNAVRRNKIHNYLWYTPNI
jgi:hypothetical protein